jgi:hypothetical protein
MSRPFIATDAMQGVGCVYKSGGKPRDAFPLACLMPLNFRHLRNTTTDSPGRAPEWLKGIHQS